MTGLEWAIAALMVLGTLFCFLASLGLVRMPDFYSRLQATTKATTLGAGLVMLAVGLFFAGEAAVTRAVAIVLFLFVTAPVSGQMLSRAAYLLGVKPWDKTLADALEPYFEAQEVGPAEPADNPDLH